ncbi:hypothetical protein DCS_07302 [Drechmeria coniospora]|uniref:Uncharacterized protein n=1 Tax=Drechmeria coniospora TaxID=98403 RepID=A0A151GE19_DRECN|nr:hypothetical protein DCS_07302 [Drechmeria coniospora]KYK55339.1 hypothetical protein DCS_07302 [Drechmeria coniospora]ODA82053.1 hypothetical protein RJ55_00558 [Drechmeria coniospora]
MTDAELDRDWKPNGRRPQSTIAQSFSLELMDIFRIEGSLTELDQKVDERRQNVGKTNQELAALDAQLREMEDRLRRSQQASAGIRLDSSTARPSHKLDASLGHEPSNLGADSTSHPGTARIAQQASSSGNMPPNPGAGEGRF